MAQRIGGVDWTSREEQWIRLRRVRPVQAREAELVLLANCRVGAGADNALRANWKREAERGRLQDVLEELTRACEFSPNVLGGLEFGDGGVRVRVRQHGVPLSVQLTNVLQADGHVFFGAEG